MSPSSGTLEIRKEDLKRLAMAALIATKFAAVGVRRTRAINVPYCSGCRNHVRWTRLGGMLGVVLSAIVYAFLGLLLGGLVWMTLQMAGTIEEKAKLPLYLIVGSAMAIGAALSLIHLRWRPRGSLARSHVRPGDALEIAGFDEQATTLRCHNNQFADEVIKANQGAQQVARVA
jgi:hypothetical protein